MLATRIGDSHLLQVGKTTDLINAAASPYHCRLQCRKLVIIQPALPDTPGEGRQLDEILATWFTHCAGCGSLG
jgi:hypothetical protein